MLEGFLPRGHYILTLSRHFLFFTFAIRGSQTLIIFRSGATFLFNRVECSSFFRCCCCNGFVFFFYNFLWVEEKVFCFVKNYCFLYSFYISWREEETARAKYKSIGDWKCEIPIIKKKNSIKKTRRRWWDCSVVSWIKQNQKKKKSFLPAPENIKKRRTEKEGSNEGRKMTGATPWTTRAKKKNNNENKASHFFSSHRERERANYKPQTCARARCCCARSASLPLFTVSVSIIIIVIIIKFCNFQVYSYTKTHKIV